MIKDHLQYTKKNSEMEVVLGGLYLEVIFNSALNVSYNQPESRSINYPYNALHLSDIFPEEKAIIKTIQTSSGAFFSTFNEEKRGFFAEFLFTANVHVYGFFCFNFVCNFIENFK